MFGQEKETVPRVIQDASGSCEFMLHFVKVNKIENFFGSEFEFFTISLLVLL